ncbi:MAG: transposase [Rhodopirellula sp.]|nr:transposase [Rhodopirellula sp.]
MPRRLRFSTGGYVFHALNRAVGREKIFQSEGDYVAFERVLQEARQVAPMRLLGFCILPNHWHLLLWPEGDEDLSEFMRWLTVTHTQRWHAYHKTSGTGPIYQGRFKSFPVEQDDHFYAVSRYVERNALRAGLVRRSEMWRWSSLWLSINERLDVSLDAWPLPRPAHWLQYVNGVETEAELAAIRESVRRGRPFGSAVWQRQTARQLGLESTLQPRGRPRRI